MSSFCTAKATHIFFSKIFQHICVSLDVNFNESLTNDIVSFEQLGPDLYSGCVKRKSAIEHAQNAHIQMILRMRKVSSGPCSPLIHSVVSNDSVIGE